jgi:GNAT superfamily N-acetyltransferase
MDDIFFTFISPLMHELPYSQWRDLHPFYKRNSFDGFPSKKDRVFVEYSKDHDIVASAVIQHKAGGFLLTAVLVDRTFRGKGIGRAFIRSLVQEWHQNQSGSLYCFADKALRSFYEQCGFDCSEGTSNLRLLLKRYETQQGSLLIFVHHG